jgi:type I restriction enzyme M protein
MYGAQAYPMSLTLGELDNYLFKCADIIRNTVDKTDYKDYILPLVFYKAISDTYRDRYEAKLEEFEDEELARDEAFHDFQIPKGYAFQDALTEGLRPSTHDGGQLVPVVRWEHNLTLAEA